LRGKKSVSKKERTSNESLIYGDLVVASRKKNIGLTRWLSKGGKRRVHPVERQKERIVLIEEKRRER